MAPPHAHTPLAARLRAAVRNPHLLPLGLLTLAVAALFIPALRLYFWWGHERFHPIGRVMALCQVWAAEGPFHAPWLPEVCFGQGWPFFTFYAPLAYDIAAILHFALRLSYGAATKWSFIASVWTAGAAMYGLTWAGFKNCGLTIADCGLNQELDNPQSNNPQSNNPQSAIRNPQSLRWWALAAALVYTFAPYHLTDVFTRASLAEAWVWAALPLLLLALESSRPRPGLGVGRIALAGAALILTHNIFALYGALIAGAWVLATARGWRWPLAALLGGLLGAALSAWFWLPALALKRYVPAGSADFMYGAPEFLRTHAVYWRQFFIERLGMGESVPGWGDGMGINLGVGVGVGLLAGVWALLRPGALGRFERRRIGVLLLFAALTMFAMTPAMPWGHVPALLRYVQFPWRLLLPATLFGALALGWSAPALRRIHPLWIAALVAAVGLAGAYGKLFTKWEAHPMSDRELPAWLAQEERALVFAGCQLGEYRPLTAPRFLLNYKFHEDYPPQPSRIMRASGPLQLIDYKHRGVSYDYDYEAPEEVRVVIQVFWFPGWTLDVDGESAKPRVGIDRELGYVELRLPPGRHLAELKYELPPSGTAGRWISVTGWILFFLLRLTQRKKRHHPGPRERAVKLQEV